MQVAEVDVINIF